MAVAGGLKETFPFPVVSVLVLPLVTCPVIAILADPALTVFVYAAARDEAPSGDEAEVVAAMPPPLLSLPQPLIAVTAAPVTTAKYAKRRTEISSIFVAY
jgi:hypothetical protein